MSAQFKSMLKFVSTDVLEIYHRLFDHFGPQHWWPAESRFEVMVGAILTQNTNWRNAERAIANLKAESLLTPKALYQLAVNRLARLIRPSGFFRLKAKRLKPMITWFWERYRGMSRVVRARPTEALRQELLDLPGIGHETADSILLYAFDKPVFVVDAYTRRVCLRHQLVRPGAGYAEIQDFFMNNLPADHHLFNEYHALLVKLAKTYCQSEPRCSRCPVADRL